MIQSDLSKAQADAMAGALMDELGYEGAREYALRMRSEVTLESNRRVWVEVTDRLRLMAHPLAFDPGLVPWILDGRKRATTRRRPKVPVGGVFYVQDGSAERGYVVTGIREGTARELIAEFWSAEGYRDPLEFAFDLVRIYPDITPDTPMATHIFEAVA